MQLLKHFATLLIAIFGQRYPLYIEIVALLKHLEGCSDYAKEICPFKQWHLLLDLYIFRQGILLQESWLEMQKKSLQSSWSCVDVCRQRLEWCKVMCQHHFTRLYWEQNLTTFTTANKLTMAMTTNKNQRSQRSWR